MRIESAIREWKSKHRRMGCVSAAEWFCKRVKGFRPLRKRFYYPCGDFWEHVVVTDGVIEIDICPYANRGKVAQQSE